MISDETVEFYFLQKEENLNISAVVCCKNREDNLYKSLDSWLLFHNITEIIILDYGSDKKIEINNKDKRIKIFRYESEYWHLAKAYNIAIQLTSNDIFLKLDCDYYLNSTFFKSNYLNTNQYIVGTPSQQTRGLLFCHKKNFIDINGYNERIFNWGGDDTDLYRRLSKYGLKEKTIEKNSVKHLDHTEELRTKYTPNPSINRLCSARRNNLDAQKNPWTKKDKMSFYNDRSK